MCNSSKALLGLVSFKFHTQHTPQNDKSRYEKTPLAEASGGNKYDQFRTNKWSTTKTSIVTEMWLES